MLTDITKMWYVLFLTLLLLMSGRIPRTDRDFSVLLESYRHQHIAHVAKDGEYQRGLLIGRSALYTEGQ